MSDGVLYCLKLNVSTCFRAGKRSPVTFKTKLSVTTVNSSFQLLPELHIRCSTGFELNIVTWSTDLLKVIPKKQNLPMIESNLEKIWKTHTPRCPKKKFSEFFRIKFFAFKIMESIWTHWNRLWLYYKFLCSMLSNDTQPFDFISSNLIWKLKSDTLRRIFTSEITGNFAAKS